MKQLTDFWNIVPKEANYITLDGYGRIKWHIQNPSLLGPVWFSRECGIILPPSSKINIYTATKICR